MIESIILLLVGLAVFVTGMDMMSAGLKKAAGRSLKNLFRKIQNNRFAALGIGTAVTAIIQSSSATSVMVVGFINAGVMTLFQGICIIMGAYIGTTMTPLIVSLSSFSISSYLIFFAFIGLVMMFFNSIKVKNIGTMLCGFGILFFGLETMSDAMSGNPELTGVFTDLFSTISFPLLLVLIGALFTVIVQSSSVTSGIVIVMVGNGTIPIISAAYIVLGATIGAITPTVIASLSSNINTKRATAVCFGERTFTAIIATIILWVVDVVAPGAFSSFLTNMFGPEHTGLAVAIFLIVYNTVANVGLLPFAHHFANWATKLIKEKEDKHLASAIQYIDDKLLATPTIAAMQAKKEIISMMGMAFENLKRGYSRVMTQNETDDKLIVDTESKIDAINGRLTSYLISLSPRLEGSDSRKVGSYFHVINDVERIGDHANNFYEMSLAMVEDELKFSETAAGEFNEMFGIIEQMCTLVTIIFSEKDQSKLHQLHQLEEKTDQLNRDFSAAHYNRIKEQRCKVELSPFYTTFISNLERVADHLVNIGYSIVDPTGADSEEK